MVKNTLYNFKWRFSLFSDLLRPRPGLDVQLPPGQRGLLLLGVRPRVVADAHRLVREGHVAHPAGQHAPVLRPHVPATLLLVGELLGAVIAPLAP